MILILTGPVRSHKTTTLFEWTKERNDCGGILTPDQEELRMIYNVRDRKTIPFQINQRQSESDFVIGRFIFDGEAFTQAVAWLNAHLADPSIQYIFLDEVGPLELGGNGWDAWLKKALHKLNDRNLVMVVREHLLDAVIKHYDLHDALVVNKDYFSETYIPQIV